MRYIEIGKVEPGMMLGKGIHDIYNRILLADGKILTEELIERLTELGYAGVYIEDELSKDIRIEYAFRKPFLWLFAILQFVLCRN